MLSFMREQGAGDQTTVPGQNQGGEAQDFLTVAANSKSLRKSTILVTILIAIGLVCLWFMIRKSRPQAASAKAADEETKIEVAISRLTGVSSEMATRMDEVVNKFYEFSDVCQVDVGELAKNPFEVEVLMKSIKEQDEAGASGREEAEKKALLKREILKKRASTLKLLSVMRSEDGNACMINDRILARGDSIEGFTIGQIGGDFVELIYQSDSGQSSGTEDLTIVLKLSE